jgi:UDP-3-O-[3-hydroxymyristoyl] glucosamine N-acyltransferase
MLETTDFFERAGPFELSKVVEAVGGSIETATAAGKMLHSVAPLSSAGADEVSFLDNKKYLPAFEASRAGACFVVAELASRAPEGMVPIVCEQPYMALALAMRLFYPSSPPEPLISPAAHVDPGASVPASCRIEAGVVIDTGVRLGERCHVEPGAVLSANVVLGDDCHVGPQASLMCCVVGNHVWIDAGARIGTQGFGFAVGPKGAVRIPHTGRVVIADDVEIGANTTIDRGSVGDTTIGQGTMIDNQVQIAHNVTIGRGCILAGQVGLAGSSEIGDFAMLGGKSGVVNHMKVGAGAKLGALSGATSDLEPGQTYLGQPAVPIRDFWRQQSAMRRLMKQGKGT